MVRMTDGSHCYGAHSGEGFALHYTLEALFVSEHNLFIIIAKRFCKDSEA